MKNKKNISLFLIFLMFCSCNDNPLESDFSSSYFPLQVGNEWSFQFPSWSPSSGDTMVTVNYKIIKKKQVNGKEYYAFNYQMPFFPSSLIIEGLDTIFVRQTQNEDIMLLIDNKEYSYFVFNKSFNPDSSNFVRSEVKGVEYCYAIESIDATVDTPLGQFRGCYIIWNYFSQIKGTEHQIWFAPGYGPVKIYYPELGVTYELSKLITH